MSHVRDSRRAAPLPVKKRLGICGLLLLTGCGAFEGKSEYQQMREKQQDFVDVIADAGGTATREGREMYGFKDVGWFMELNGVEISDRLLAAIAEVVKKDPVFELNLSKSTITDDQLAQLDADKVLQKVFFLDLSDTAITDAGLDNISNFYVIRELKVKGTKVTPEAVQRLGDKQLAQKHTPKPFRKRPKADI